jgi:hypothetical protein
MTNRDLLRSLLTEADRETASRLQTLLDEPVSDLDNLKADTDFQKRFGMHTPAFQDLAANVILCARDYTNTAVGEYVKNLMQEKHTLELDLAEARIDPKFSQSNVQAAIIAGQADDIKRLKDELREAKADAERAKMERNKLSNEHHEVSTLKAENERLQKAHDHQYSMAGQMLREAEQKSRENDILAVSCARAQSALRNAGFTLVEGHDGPTWNPPLAVGSFHRLCTDACLEADHARGLFPKPDHLTLALAEEAGEVTKAVLDYKQKKTHLAAVRKEIVQTMAMCLRLACEGDPTVDLKRSQE